MSFFGEGGLSASFFSATGDTKTEEKLRIRDLFWEYTLLLFVDDSCLLEKYPNIKMMSWLRFVITLVF